MENKEFSKSLEKIQEIMVAVSTQGKDIGEVNDEYKILYTKILKELYSKNITNKNEHISLGDFRDFWKNNELKTYQSRRNYIRELYKNVEYEILLKDNEINKSSNLISSDNYFSIERINEIKQMNCLFDLSKLTQLLQEVNICYKNNCFLGTSCLLRILLDHIPPIFGKGSFSIIVNNCSLPQSDKKSMLHLLGGFKNIADGNLHNHISEKECLPNKNTLAHIPEFDILLKNIIIQISKISK